MINKELDISGECRRLDQLLLAYLRAADAPPWPGADGVTLADVLQSYPRSAVDGLVPDLPALLQKHPELAEVLRDFFVHCEK
jgi:hypothetical protein